MSAEELIALADRHYAPDDRAHKGEALLRVYGRLLAERRHLPLVLLELGVYRGASLRIWRDYLPRATIVGFDVDPRCQVELSGVHIVHGDQADSKALGRTLSAAGNLLFDIIIDDASHLGLKSKAAFAYLFVNALKPAGIYVVEDIAAPFLKDWPDGAPFSRPPVQSLTGYQHGMVGFLKQVVDELAVSVVEESAYPIADITFYPNICVVRKSP